MRSVRPQTVTLIVFAILLALASAIVFKTFLLTPRPVVQAPPPPPPDLVQALVWQSNLPVNARIRDSDVAVKQLPRGLVKTGALVFLEQVRGRICKVPIAAANVVMVSDFYDMQKDKPPTWHDVLPPDHRVLPLRVDDPSFSPTMLQPNSYIDVSLTIDRPDNDIRTTTLLVHGIQVVSPPVTDGGVPNIVSATHDGKVSINVSVTGEQAAKLTQAQQSGGLISVSLLPGPPTEGDVAVNPIDTNGLLHIKPPTGAAHTIATYSQCGCSLAWHAGFIFGFRRRR